MFLYGMTSPWNIARININSRWRHDMKAPFALLSIVHRWIHLTKGQSCRALLFFIVVNPNRLKLWVIWDALRRSCDVTVLCALRDTRRKCFITLGEIPKLVFMVSNFRATRKYYLCCDKRCVRNSMMAPDRRCGYVIKFLTQITLWIHQHRHTFH